MDVYLNLKVYVLLVIIQEAIINLSLAEQGIGCKRRKTLLHRGLFTHKYLGPQCSPDTHSVVPSSSLEEIADTRNDTNNSIQFSSAFKLR